MFQYASKVGDATGGGIRPDSCRLRLVAEGGRIQTLHLAGFGDYRMLGAPVHCSGAEAPANPAPGLGQHTDELLRDLGYDDAKLDRLRRAKAI